MEERRVRPADGTLYFPKNPRRTSSVKMMTTSDASVSTAMPSCLGLTGRGADARSTETSTWFGLAGRRKRSAYQGPPLPTGSQPSATSRWTSSSWASRAPALVSGGGLSSRQRNVGERPGASPTPGPSGRASNSEARNERTHSISHQDQSGAGSPSSVAVPGGGLVSTCGVPQCGQNRAPSGTLSPQLAHGSIAFSCSITFLVCTDRGSELPPIIPMASASAP
jgi:hypothetical protein